MSASLGEDGEQLAEDFLRGLGYRMVARNVRSSLGQVDLVARDRSTLVLVEVKTRAGAGFGSPAEGVGPWKRRKLQQLALAYARRVRHRGAYRIDVVSIVASPGAPPRIEHFKGAVGDQ
jgi:putative endonuclease